MHRTHALCVCVCVCVSVHTISSAAPPTSTVVQPAAAPYSSEAAASKAVCAMKLQLPEALSCLTHRPIIDVLQILPRTFKTQEKDLHEVHWPKKAEWRLDSC